MFRFERRPHGPNADLYVLESLTLLRSMKAPISRNGLLASSFFALLLSACSSGGGGGSSVDTTAPTLTSTPSLAPAPNPDTPLAATLSVTTDEPTTILLHINDGTQSWTSQPDASFLTSHTLPVLGLRPGKTHVIRAEAKDAADNTTFVGVFALVTDPLPAEFPPLDVKVADTVSMEPGVLMFSAMGIDPVTSERGSFVTMLDESGEVIWYHFTSGQASDLRRLSNGNLIYTYDSLGIREIDMLGNTVGEWWATNINPNAPAGAIGMPVDTFHHEIFEMPEGSAGDFLTLSTESRTYANYPASVLDPSITSASADVIGDVIVEFKRDGTIVNQWYLLDILDPFRMSYDTLGTYWDRIYNKPTVDWSHANAVILDESDNSMIVSTRNQDAVVKIDRATGQLVWILGDPGRWVTPYANKLLNLGVGAEWPYRQHAPEITPSGTLLLFDNGNERAIPPSAGLPGAMQYSRAVEFEIDLGLNEVRQAWAYGGPSTPYLSTFLGDADLMPQTDNVLVTDGGKDLGTHRYGRIFEVTRDSNERIVFELEVQDKSPNPMTWIIYRAEKLPGIYR